MKQRDRPVRPLKSGLPGFTMTEVLIVMAIAGVLAALATPSFNEMVKSQRMKSMATDLNQSLLRTRSEAIKRNKSVTLSPTTVGAWQNGWRIADPDNGGTFLEIHDAFSGLTATGPTSVTYQTSGRIQGTAAPAFNISAADSSSQRCVSVDLSGRPYTKASAC